MTNIVSLQSASLNLVGYRAGLRERLLQRGPESLADEEILEMLLFLSFPRGNTKLLSAGLIYEFGTLGGVIAASSSELENKIDLPAETVFVLRLVAAAAERLTQADTDDLPQLRSLYCIEAYLAEHDHPLDTTRLLFLDPKMCLLGDEASNDSGMLDPRPILRRALKLNATALFVVDICGALPARSRAEAALRLAEAGALVSVTLLDQLVFCASGLWSYRAAGLLKPVGQQSNRFPGFSA